MERTKQDDKTGQTDRQTDKQTDRQTDNKTRQIDRQEAEEETLRPNCIYSSTLGTKNEKSVLTKLKLTSQQT